MVKHDIKIDDKTKLCIGKIYTTTNEYIGQITKIEYDVLLFIMILFTNYIYT